MVTVRRSGDRGRFDFGWLDTRHTFSFGEYHDPKWMGYRWLRVINEDWVAPGRGFGTHPHRDMEIITYVVSGALAHKDSTGAEGTIRPGDVQRMTAGRGVTHSEFNPSEKERTHLLQIWILPRERGLEPSYEQEHFDESQRRGRLRLIASPDGADGSVTIQQDVRVYAAHLVTGDRAGFDLGPGRAAWVQVVGGEVTANWTRLNAGDGAAIEGEPRVDISASKDSEVLVFDLA